MSAIVLHFPAMPAPNRIRELRLARAMSQDDLAALVGCSKMQISGLERGKPRLDIVWMQRLAPCLGCHPGDLLNPGDNAAAPQTREEQRLLEIYRQAAPEEQKRILAVGEALAAYRGEGEAA